MEDSTKPLISSSRLLNSFSSSSKCRIAQSAVGRWVAGGKQTHLTPRPPRVFAAIPLLTKSTRDVVFGLLFRRRLEYFDRIVELYQLAQQKKAGAVRHAGGLLHVMGDDDDRAAALQGEQQLLDLRCGDRIKG